MGDSVDTYDHVAIPNFLLKRFSLKKRGNLYFLYWYHIELAVCIELKTKEIGVLENHYSDDVEKGLLADDLETKMQSALLKLESTNFAYYYVEKHKKLILKFCTTMFARAEKFKDKTMLKTKVCNDIDHSTFVKLSSKIEMIKQVFGNLELCNLKSLAVQQNFNNSLGIGIIDFSGIKGFIVPIDSLNYLCLVDNKEKFDKFISEPKHIIQNKINLSMIKTELHIGRGFVVFNNEVQLLYIKELIEIIMSNNIGKI